MAQGARKRGHGNQEFVTFVTWLYSLWNLTDYENRFFVTFVTFQRNAVLRGAGAAAGLAQAASWGCPTWGASTRGWGHGHPEFVTFVTWWYSLGNLINYENQILVTFGHIPVQCWAQRPWGCSWAGFQAAPWGVPAGAPQHEGGAMGTQNLSHLSHCGIPWGI